MPNLTPVVEIILVSQINHHRTRQMSEILVREIYYGITFGPEFERNTSCLLIYSVRRKYSRKEG